MRLLRTCSWMAVAAALAISLTTGCARRARQGPPPTPTTAPTPAETTPPTPAETTPPTPAETTPPVLSESDLQPVFFEFDSYALGDEGRGVLDRNARVLREGTDAKLTIEGHCDERGTVEYNQALGEKRAQAARDYLVAAGISASRLRTISYGKERPFDPGHDEAAWAKNRRAQFVIPR